MLKAADARAALLQDIVARLRAGQAASALEACVAALADHPSDADFARWAAVAAVALRDWANAEAFARRSLDSRADDAPTLVLLGRSLRAVGRLGEAVAAFEAANRCEPDGSAAAFLLCATLLQAGDPRAVAMIQGLLARFPHDAGGWEEVGTVLADLGKPAAALTCFERAMRSAPTSALAMRLGLLLKGLGRLTEAAEAFRTAADLAPGSSRARFMQGLCLQDGGDLAAAAAAYRDALALDPALAEAAVNLGTVLQDEGDLAAAKRAYGQALAARPDTFGRIAQAMTTSSRGELWLDLGKLRRSLAG